ncbi:type I-B CRISPR-associated protein Cas8b/Csh1 [Haloferax sp. MBLA0076]|uniref:Type I-B CRISPR-associated protein Cas8b/Csh1 n=1 Tax=Haloferax litoreum TaxID=2666140 RepID=A0A6A8GFL5_9EURY|nr:type I-B CRISPR-associated protein Cas8b/Csh1 [Haloferax sp. CBA1148]MRX22164.1 type I-B CRISPR-associated protein Cas8b/Csh1 [Haloferax litoreum]
MLKPEEFKQTYEGDLVDELPDSPITSLRKLQFLYGKLYTLATAGGGQYAPYLTPDAAGDLVDTEGSLIVVRVDLSGDESQLADDDRGPVWVTRYTDDRVEKVAHSKYPAARGIDHSITHQAGRNSDPEKLGRYAVERLSKWATDDVVQGTAANSEQGWIVNELANLGDDEDVAERIKEAVDAELGGESTTALLTVQVRRSEDEEYRWPSDIDVFLEAMRRRKLSKLVSKGQASDSSGKATDLITGQRTRTVGTSEDPQNYYLGKQLEKFPGLDPDEAWRTHPVSEDAAVTMMNSETFVEACTYRTFGAKVYCLPYFFGTPTPEKAIKLYALLHQAATADDGMTPVEQMYNNVGVSDDTLRFYVSAVMPHQMSRYDVFGESMNGRLLYPVALEQAHDAIVLTSAFDSDDDWTAPMPTHEKWDLLVPAESRLHSVSNGWYFAQTFAKRDDTDASADDPRIGALVSVLSGDSINVQTLLGEYVDRIIAEEGEEFPSFQVAGQFAQLCALASTDLDLLDADDEHMQPITREPTYEIPDSNMHQTEPAIADGGTPTAKLASFIKDTPALSQDSDTPVTDQRRGAFLLGALVGAVGNYQDYSEGRSTTVVDQYPVKSITQARVKKVTQEAIAKTLTYTRQEKKQGVSYGGTKFDHIVDQLRETILETDPEDWEIDTDDLRFYYALGVTYGMNDRKKSTNNTADNNEDN